MNLLNKKDINECCKLLNEIQTMIGEAKTHVFLFNIYYDFYYALDVDGEGLGEADNTTMLKQMFVKPISPMVFQLRQIQDLKPNMIYIIKKTPRKDPACLQNLLLALIKNHLPSISFQISTLLNTTDVTADQIVKAICGCYQVPLIQREVNMIYDRQYVFAVYARLYLNHNPSDLESDYDLELMLKNNSYFIYAFEKN